MTTMIRQCNDIPSNDNFLGRMIARRRGNGMCSVLYGIKIYVTLIRLLETFAAVP